MVEVGTATKGEKEIRKDWPIEEGLTAGTTKTHDRITYLQPEESNLTLGDKEGIY